MRAERHCAREGKIALLDAHHHPAQARIRSNLNLITASGHVYSFPLTEISIDPNAEPDLKIFIEPKEQSGIGGVLSRKATFRPTDASELAKRWFKSHKPIAKSA